VPCFMGPCARRAGTKFGGSAIGISCAQGRQLVRVARDFYKISCDSARRAPNRD
jgi:hypothetical protein